MNSCSRNSAPGYATRILCPCRGILLCDEERRPRRTWASLVVLYMTDFVMYSVEGMRERVIAS